MAAAAFDTMPTSYPERFWSHTKPADNGCIVWTGCIQSRNGRTAGGYGQCQYGLTHRVAWMLRFGAIPRGLCVCHKCDNPPCVNPDHLRLGTIADNQREMRLKGRAVNPLALSQAAKTHCSNGHEFTDENTAIARGNGQRVCRMCACLKSRRVRAARRQS